MEQKLDLRIQKTYMSVTKALIEMMEEMPFEDIKVKELCDRAMIRKSTFYKHFADKYELLAFIVKEVINDYNERIRQDSPADDPVAFYNKMSSVSPRTFIRVLFLQIGHSNQIFSIFCPLIYCFCEKFKKHTCFFCIKLL